MKILRDPLFHFVVLGALLFVVYSIAADVFSTDENRRIEIGTAEIEFLAAAWQRQWQRPPTEQELNGLVKGRVREEVLYREALAVGLDENDVVVRRRMVQKMELLSQDLALLADPTDEELQTFFGERQEDYRISPRLSFSHVYFNHDQRGASAEKDALEALAEINTVTPPPRRSPERGDRFMPGYDFDLHSPPEVQRLFGTQFAEELFELQPGWQGPILSGYGLHLVYIGERVESRIPEYQEITDKLVVDYNRWRRQQADEALYMGLSGRYKIEIDRDAIQRFALQK